MRKFLHYIGIELDDDFRFRKEIALRMKREYHRNTGRRALKTSLGLQILGYPFILELVTGIES